MEFVPHPSDAAVKRLLSQAGLAACDIGPEILANFFACSINDELEGVVGLELYRDVALLRSLAVTSSHRRGGIGSALVAHAERHASAHGVTGLYLLTTTAEQFFVRLGYARVARHDVPGAIRNTMEYSNICPISAAVMFKELQLTANSRADGS